MISSGMRSGKHNTTNTIERRIAFFSESSMDRVGIKKVKVGGGGVNVDQLPSQRQDSTQTEKQ
jgi:hypothetical protein